jgi:hypothetical protein
MLGNSMSTSIEDFILQVSAWASSKPEIIGIVLVGSYARGEARLDSDVDLVIVLEDQRILMAGEKWAGCFGTIDDLSWENWGKVQSLRVYYSSGMEVEFGLTDRDWLASPIDEGTKNVLQQGLMIICDPQQYVSRQLNDNGILYRVFGSGDA